MGMMDRPLYFDRQGRPIELMDWARKMEDDKYRLVAQDMVGAYWVSTVWIGLDMSFMSDAPMIFETMVFSRENGPQGEAIDGRRYATEAEAIHWHDQMVAELRARVSG